MLAASGAARVTIEQHPDGMPHTRATIRTMAKLARDASHTYPIRSLATRIVEHVPSKQVRGELAALYAWVRDNIRYRFDPVDLEWVQSPERTLKERAGDCDDLATLLAAFAGSLGHRWRFKTVGPRPGVMKHVFAEVFDGTNWVTLDPVLEPPQTTTAARSDVGAFGRAVPARASHVWSDGGTMLMGLGAGWPAFGGRYHRARPGKRTKRVHVQAHTRGWPSLGVTNDALAHWVRGGNFAGAVGNRGIAMWEGQLGGCRCLHVETPASLARMRMARQAGLSGSVGEGGRELWSFEAYYPSDPTNWGGAGIPPVPSPAYRSTGVAGPILFTAPAGELTEGPGQLSGLGHLGFGLFKAIGKAVSGAVKVVGKIPGVNLVTKAAASIIPGGSLALDAAKSIGKLVGGAKGAAAVKAGADLVADAAVTADAVKDMIAPPPGCPGPAPASRGDIDQLAQQIAVSAKYCTKADLTPLMLAITDRNNKACAAQLAAARASSAKELAAARAAAGNAQKKAVAAAKALVLKTAAKQAARMRKSYDRKLSKLNARLKAFRAGKYPKGSRQKFDPKTNTWKVYAPATTKAQKSTLKGLGFGFRPTVSFSLGALGAAKQSAPRALAAVVDFMKRNKNQAPQVALPALKTFQSDVGLKPDGIYGQNTRAALAYTLARGDLPVVAKPYAKAKVTWKPPAAVTPARPVAAAKAAAQPQLLQTTPATATSPAVVSASAPSTAITLPPDLPPAPVYSPALPDVIPTSSVSRAAVMATPVMAMSPATPDADAPKGYIPVDRTSTDPKLPSIAKVPDHYIDVSGPRIVSGKKPMHAGKRKARGGTERALMWAAIGLMLGETLLHRRAA